MKVHTHVLMDEQSKQADKFLISKRCVSAGDALKGFDLSAPDLSKLSYLECYFSFDALLPRQCGKTILGET